jgi:hypothetical protein
VAQTKRKRQTKHRGNAAGMVESRGRTGRKPTTAEKTGKASSSEKRLARMDSPPTWRAAFYKALVAAVLMVAISLLLLGKRNQTEAFVLFPVVLLFYVPISYYTDMWVFRRRQRQKPSGKGTK